MDIRAAAMGLACALMWCFAVTSARIIVADTAPLFSLALRCLVSGLPGFAIARPPPVPAAFGDRARS